MAQKSSIHRGSIRFNVFVQTLVFLLLFAIVN